MHCVLQFSYRAWYTAKLIRRPIDVYIIYRFRCFMRDLREGETSMPRMLHYYISVCCLWSAYGSVLSSRFQLYTSTIFFIGQIFQGRHYGRYCRLVSTSIVLVVWLLSGCPLVLFCSALLVEAV